MGEITGFVSKSELERLRLIREARAIYDSIFPPADAVDKQPNDQVGNGDAAGPKGRVSSKADARMTGR
jgi:hypothetical protein